MIALPIRGDRVDKKGYVIRDFVTGEELGDELSEYYIGRAVTIEGSSVLVGVIIDVTFTMVFIDTIPATKYVALEKVIKELTNLKKTAVEVVGRGDMKNAEEAVKVLEEVLNRAKELAVLKLVRALGIFPVKAENRQEAIVRAMKKAEPFVKYIAAHTGTSEQFVKGVIVRNIEWEKSKFAEKLFRSLFV
ncbi:hypothetical protein [Pyrococcus kukulkanii]|uniref:Uncharacterized protein n=1 Tax=Pyrococcus kukulkanii TaxID=1609559 RepID=A0ABV4T5I1_9EURY